MVCVESTLACRVAPPSDVTEPSQLKPFDPTAEWGINREAGEVGRRFSIEKTALNVELKLMGSWEMLTSGRPEDS